MRAAVAILDAHSRGEECKLDPEAPGRPEAALSASAASTAELELNVCMRLAVLLERSAAAGDAEADLAEAAMLYRRALASVRGLVGGASGEAAAHYGRIEAALQTRTVAK